MVLKEVRGLINLAPNMSEVSVISASQLFSAVSMIRILRAGEGLAGVSHNEEIQTGAVVTELRI